MWEQKTNDDISESQKAPSSMLLFPLGEIGYLKSYCADVLFPLLGEIGMTGEERALIVKIASGF